MRHLGWLAVLVVVVGGCGEDEGGGGAPASDGMTSNGTASGTGGNGSTSPVSTSGVGAGSVEGAKALFAQAPCRFTDIEGRVWTYTYTPTHVDIQTEGIEGTSAGEPTPPRPFCHRVLFDAVAPYRTEVYLGTCEGGEFAGVDVYTWGDIGPTSGTTPNTIGQSHWVNVAEPTGTLSYVGVWLPFEGRLKSAKTIFPDGEEIVYEDWDVLRWSTVPDFTGPVFGCNECLAELECN